MAARAARAARAPAIASSAKRDTGQGSLAAALFPNLRKLGIEAGIVLLLIAIGIAIAWKLSVRNVHNPRPLGGRNVDVTPVPGSQTEAAFTTVPGRPHVLFGVDDGLNLHLSRDDGRTWRADDSGALTNNLCTHRDPRVAVDASGREYVAFVASSFCQDELQPYLLVASRASGSTRWHIVRVAKPTWKFGYDDAPALAVAAGGTVYVAWTRSLGSQREAVVVSRSIDHGATWSVPLVVDPDGARPHLAQLAVAGSVVYVGGIDVPRGIWAARSADGGRTFTKPTQLAPLTANPAGACARTGETPVANEARTCIGPNLSLLASRDRVYAVYADGPRVVLGAAAASLKPLFRAGVVPAGKAQQFQPVAALDSSDGVLWACWYDTSFWPGGKKAWFTCSHSPDGRHWAAPVRASAVPTPLDYLFGTFAYSGLEPSLTAAAGVAHPFWIDGRSVDNLNDIFTAAIPLSR